MSKQAKIDVIINSEEAKKRFEELQGELKDIKILRDQAFAKGDIGAFATYNKELKDVNKEMKQFKTQTDDVENALKNINKISTNDLENAFRKARNEMKATARDADNYTAKKANFEKLRDEVEKVNGSVKSQGSFFSKAGDNFNKYFGMAGAAIASFTGVFLGLKQTITDFNDYQKKVANLSALTGLKGDELDWISQKAKEMSTTVTEEGVRITQGADVIIDAFTKMGSAQPELLKNKEALAEVTKQAIILSEAAGMELQPAVDGLALTMNQYGASSKEAARYVNVLAAGSKAGAAEIPDISAAIVKFGAAAKSANVSVEESVGLIEALSEKGIKGEIAGTGLKTMLVKLMNGADEFNPKVVGMQKALDNLANANLSSTEITKMFGLENFTVAKSLIESRTRVEELTKAVTGTNVAYEQANTNTETNAAKLEQQKNKIKLISIELGEKLAPIMSNSLGLFTKFMQVIIATINFYAKYSYAINSTVAVIATYITVTKLQAFWTAFTTKTTVDGIVVSKLSILQQKLHVFWTTAGTAATQLFAAAQFLFTGRLKEAKIAFQAFNTTMKTSPWGIALAAALALGLALYALIRRKKELVTATSNMIGQYQEEKTESDKLFESIKKTKEGTEGRAKAIQMVNDKYGAYVGYLLDEKAGLQDIAKYQDIVNESLMKNIAIKSQQQEIDRVLKESQDAIKTEFDAVISDIESSQGSAVAGQAGIDLNQVITNIIRDPNAASGEIAFRNKYGINPGEMVDKMNQVRDAVRKRNAEMDRINLFFDSYIKNLRGNVVPSGGTPTPTGGNNSPDSGGNNSPASGNDWSLESDKDHLQKLKELKKRFISGEIKTQEDFDEEILQLEIQTLQDRIIANKDTSEVLNKINSQLIDKQLEDHKNGIKRKADAAKEYEELTKKDIEKIQQDNEKALTDLQMRNNNEFASITSLEQAKAFLKDTMSAEELAKITNVYDAKQALRKKYDKDEQQLAIDQMAKLIEIFQQVSKDGFVNDINLGEMLLTPEQEADLKVKLAKLQEDFAKLKAQANTGEKPTDGTDKPKKELNNVKTDVFGFSPEDWQSMYDNIANAKFMSDEWLDSFAEGLSMVGNSMTEIWSSYAEIATKSEQKELDKFVKVQDAKKKKLQKNLDQGRVSQESFNAQVEAMDAEVERKKAVAARNQAKRERDIALMSAIVNTAAGAVKALPNFILAGIIAALGGIQIAKIMATPLPEIPGAETGGSLQEVIRAQDGKRFSAANNPTQRGYVGRPTIIAGENGTEYVVPAEGVNNPSIRNMLNMIEMARQNGSLATINLPQIRTLSGRETGGFTASASTTQIRNQTAIYNQQTADLSQLSTVMAKLTEQLDKGITAKTYLRGPRGIFEAMKEDETLIANAKK